MPPIFAAGELGAFPVCGPLPYLRLTLDEVRLALQESELLPASTWFHATTEAAACSAARYGLVPSCWRGGDTCCVFGYARRGDVPPRRRGEWIIEIRSRALPGQLKAWWVPPQAVRGAWHEERFHPSAELRPRAVEPVVEGACHCELDAVTRQQIEQWRVVCGRGLRAG